MPVFARLRNYIQYLHVGAFLGFRQIRRGNIWINLLIISIMTLTFLSLIVIPGILVGLTEGSFKQNREHFTGDLFLSTLPDDQSIVNTQHIVQTLEVLPEVAEYSVRYQTGATIQSGYVKRDDFTRDAESIGVSAYAIDPTREEATTELSSFLVEGEMLAEGESGYVLVGATLLKKYSAFSDLFEPLEYVEVGQKIKLSLEGEPLSNLERDQALLQTNKEDGGRTTEFIVKGIIDSKVSEVSSTVFITEQDYRRITGKTSLQAQEIAIKTHPGVSDDYFKQVLVNYGFDEHAKIQTATEAIPKFLADVQQTFGLLGLVIGMIGLVVSSITIFIVIYINALTRRKYIGILKGIGISARAIEFAYLLQSIFYALIGIGIGVVIVYALLVPFFAQNPIDFPFSDGILVAEIGTTVTRSLVLLLVTMFAGFLPAYLIVRQNTLDSILQR